MTNIQKIVDALNGFDALPFGKANAALDQMMKDAEAALNERDALLKALEGLLAIVSDSRGVSGYHMNGDLAEWDEFEEVAAAEAAILSAKGGA